MKMLGSWITNGTESPFYARKTFKLTKAVQLATAKVCGLGQFNFYMNGQKVEDHVLDPGWTNYNRIIQYVTFDVTNQICNGKNVIGAEVGNGWFIMNNTHYTFTFPDFMPPNPNPYIPFGKSLVLSVSLWISYEDGTVEIIESDNTWKVAAHPIIASNVFGSETMDGRKVKNGWEFADYDDSDWEQAYVLQADEGPKGKFMEQSQPPIRVKKTFEGIYLHSCKGREIYDFTQNMSGMLEFQVKGKRGDIIEVFPAEKLDKNGDIDQVAKNWVTIDSCNTYIIGNDDKWETFQMKFTYFAGRYVAIKGASHKRSDKKALIQNLKAHYITSAWKDSGSFQCGDKRFEEIYHLVYSSVEANMLSVHTDCPTIERFAWQEPNHLMAPSIMFMKNVKKHWEKFLLDLRAEQHTEEDYFNDLSGGKYYPGDGLMPSQAPCYIHNVLPVPGTGSFYDVITWGSTSILGTYWHYLFYGDETIIKDNYEPGLRYLEHLKGKMDEEGFISHGLGDWGNPTGEFSKKNVETAILYADAIVLAKFADILGNGKHKAELLFFAEEVKENYNKKLLVKHPTEDFWYYKVDNENSGFITQAAQALPLFWDMVPENRKSHVERAFGYVIHKDKSFVSGEVGLPYIIQTMRALNMNDQICEFILKEEHPSYYAFVLAGETTLGEYWEENPRSHNHDMMGHIIEWYYNGIAGIQILEPGVKKVMIKPYLPKSMNSFHCKFQSVKGLIEVKIRETFDEIELSVKIPNGIVYSIDSSLLMDQGKKVIINNNTLWV